MYAYFRRALISLLVLLGVLSVTSRASYAQSANSAIEVWLSNYNANDITGYTPSAFTGTQPGDNPPEITVANGIQGPESVAQDPSGNLWVSDVFNGTVVGYTPPFNGAPSYVINLGLGSVPTGVAFDSSGNLYVATLSNNSVRVFNNPTANTDGAVSYIIEGSHTGISWPAQMILDSSGNIYLADALVGALVFAPVNPATDPNCNASSGVPICNVSPRYILSWRPKASGNGVSLDASNDLFLTDSQETAIIMFNKSTLDSCAAMGGECTTSPSASISGPDTGLNGPAAVSVAGGETFVCNQADSGTVSSITVYNNSTLTNGGAQDLPPIATETGPNSAVVDCNSILAVSVGPVPFANFIGTLDLTVSTGSFDLNSSFSLSSGSNGIHPVAENVTLQIGPYSVAIPAGSFTQTKQGAYVFDGTIDGVALQLRINPTGSNSYTLQAQGNGANLGGVSNPVTVTLTIGDDTGSTQISAQIS